MEEEKKENQGFHPASQQTQQSKEATPKKTEDKFHRTISAQEKLELVMSVLKGKKTVEEVMAEVNISKEGFYKWLRLAMDGMKEKLEPVGRGRKAKEDPAQKSERERLEKENRRLEKEKLKLETQIEIQKQVIELQKQYKEKKRREQRG